MQRVHTLFVAWTVGITWEFVCSASGTGILAIIPALCCHDLSTASQTLPWIALQSIEKREKGQIHRTLTSAAASPATREKVSF